MWWLSYIIYAAVCFGLIIVDLFILNQSLSNIDSSLFGIGVMCLISHRDSCRKNNKYSFKWKYYGL